MTTPVLARAAFGASAQADADPTAWQPSADQARLVAVVHLDMVGYSRLTELDEAGTLVRLRGVRDGLLHPLVAQAGGRMVGSAGDSALIIFPGAAAALRFALAFQGAMAAREAGEPEHRIMRFRVGINVADVLMDGMGVHGDGVNVAARLQTACPPGAVCASRTVREQLRHRLDADFEPFGALTFKNIAHPVEAYVVRPHEAGSKPGWHRTVTRRIGSIFLAKRWRATVLLPASSAILAVPLFLLFPSFRERVNVARPDVRVAASVTPRAQAERLLRQGRALGCPEHPCPREWLAARTLFEQAIAADPTYAPPYAEATFTYTNFVASGLSLNEKEDLRAAEQLATRAAALAPEEAFAHEARAAVLRQDPDRLEDALAAYLRSLAIEPNQPSVRANAGWMLVLLGRPAEAEPFLRAALGEAPEHRRASAWLTYLGLAELFLDREGHGAAQLRQALVMQPQNAAADDIVLQRKLILSAALALDGKVNEAEQVVGDLRRQHLALSTRTPTLWNCRCSHEKDFLAGLEKLRQGLVLAGVADVR